MYLKITSRLSGIVWISRVTGHCSQFASSSSVYPMRKYIFLGLIARFIITATRMWLNCRLMMTSELTSEWKVEVINLRMKMSSVIVCASRKFSPRRFTKKYRKLSALKFTGSFSNFNQCSTSSKLFYERFDEEDLPFRRSKDGLVSEWLCIFPTDFYSTHTTS